MIERKIVSYILIYSPNANLLTDEVNRFISLNYIPYGNPFARTIQESDVNMLCIEDPRRAFLYQAMVKYEEKL